MASVKTFNRSVRAVLMLYFSLALLTSQGATTAKAQSQDLLQQKLDFLKETLESHLSHAVGAEAGLNLGNLKFEAINFETCKITWKISTEYGDSADVPMPFRDLKIVSQVSVSLSSIDAARTKVYLIEQMKQRNIAWSLILQLSVRFGSPGFTQQLVTTKGRQVTRTTLEERQNGFFFHFRDKQVAEDVSKAFADAGAICRSRPQRSR
jgi:hypothetical protein